MNIQRNDGRKVTERLPVRYRLLDKDGRQCGIYNSAMEAASAAGGYWPGIGQDQDREGWGWDIEVVSEKQNSP